MAWDESKHPRVPKGNSSGGEFTKRTGYSSTENTVDKIVRLVSTNPFTLDNDVRIIDKDAIPQNHREFTNAKSVDDFFFYDDEHRGLLAKRNSSCIEL